MKNDFPLFKNMKSYGFWEQLSEEELIYVFSEIFGEPVRYRYDIIYDKNGNILYYEDYNGYWEKYEYDENGDILYKEYSNGYWEKWEYDEYGNQIYYEHSTGYWEKWEYDENGNEIYYENSRGEIRDNR